MEQWRTVMARAAATGTEGSKRRSRACLRRAVDGGLVNGAGAGLARAWNVEVEGRPAAGRARLAVHIESECQATGVMQLRFLLQRMVSCGLYVTKMALESDIAIEGRAPCDFHRLFDRTND